MPTAGRPPATSRFESLYAKFFGRWKPAHCSVLNGIRFIRESNTSPLALKGRDGSAVCHSSLFEAAELANALEASLSRGHMFQLDHRSTEMVGGAKPSRAR